MADEEGVRPNAVKGPDSPFTDRFRDVNFGDRSPHGSLANFLVDVGIREPNASYPVGGSPKASSR